ncbi:MBL fold metallo-hydrolase [Amycolatopsis sp.]|uniref:MBL fold metallo-hydrolase n=1 Tax=Amycolatopsis sp. TaxID=37632 RepID=UPI002BE3EE10|nr:MBL fold metallo-hydrolase [Amycolatopsis sp.]HVV11320.1 MBL fold metallo-hydrolase [Amycolatopsis sp.]
MTITIGEVTIDRITELDRWPFPRAELFPGITEADVAAAGLGQHEVDPATGELLLSIHTYLVRTPDTTILVDSGNGNGKQRPALPAHHEFDTDYLERLGVAPGDIDVVVSTHLHPDHCGWNTRLAGGEWVPTFPSARYVFSRNEFEQLRALAGSAPADPVLADIARMYADSVEPVVRSGQVELVDVPHALDSGPAHRVALVPRPGHTAGHLTVEVTAGPRAALLTGDLVHHPIQFPVPSLSQAGDADPAEAAASRKAVFERCADEDVLVLPAHFRPPAPEFVAGRIHRTADGFRFEWASRTEP